MCWDQFPELVYFFLCLSLSVSRSVGFLRLREKMFKLKLNFVVQKESGIKFVESVYFSGQRVLTHC